MEKREEAFALHGSYRLDKEEWFSEKKTYEVYEEGTSGRPEEMLIVLISYFLMAMIPVVGWMLSPLISIMWAFFLLLVSISETTVYPTFL